MSETTQVYTTPRYMAVQPHNDVVWECLFDEKQRYSCLVFLGTDGNLWMIQGYTGEV